MHTSFISGELDKGIFEALESYLNELNKPMTDSPDPYDVFDVQGDLSFFYRIPPFNQDVRLQTPSNVAQVVLRVACRQSDNRELCIKQATHFVQMQLDYFGEIDITNEALFHELTNISRLIETLCKYDLLTKVMSGPLLCFKFAFIANNWTQKIKSSGTVEDLSFLIKIINHIRIFFTGYVARNYLTEKFTRYHIEIILQIFVSLESLINHLGVDRVKISYQHLVDFIRFIAFFSERNLIDSDNPMPQRVGQALQTIFKLIDLSLVPPNSDQWNKLLMNIAFLVTDPAVKAEVPQAVIKHIVKITTHLNECDDGKQLLRSIIAIGKIMSTYKDKILDAELIVALQRLFNQLPGQLHKQSRDLSLKILEEVLNIAQEHNFVLHTEKTWKSFLGSELFPSLQQNVDDPAVKKRLRNEISRSLNVIKNMKSHGMFTQSEFNDWIMQLLNNPALLYVEKYGNERRLQLNFHEFNIATATLAFEIWYGCRDENEKMDFWVVVGRGNTTNEESMVSQDDPIFGKVAPMNPLKNAFFELFRELRSEYTFELSYPLGDASNINDGAIFVAETKEGMDLAKSRNIRIQNGSLTLSARSLSARTDSNVAADGTATASPILRAASHLPMRTDEAGPIQKKQKMDVGANQTL